MNFRHAFSGPAAMVAVALSVALVPSLEVEAQHAMSVDLVIRGATVLRADGAEALSGQTVLVAHGSVLQVVPDAAVQIPDGSEGVHDAEGGFLLMGLADLYADAEALDSMIDEIEARVAGGQSAAAALASAATAAGSVDPLGVIASGSAADFVLLASDPREDISALRRLKAIVTNGEWLHREEEPVAASSANEPRR